MKNNISTKKINNFKDFEKEIELIEKLNSFKIKKIHLLGNRNLTARLSKKQSSFYMEINAEIMFESNLSFMIDEKIYQTKNLENSSKDITKNVKKTSNIETNIEIKDFHSKDFKKIGLFKAIFIVDIKDLRRFHNEFETVTYQDSTTEYFYNCLRISLNDREYDVTQFKDKKNGYYIFECLQIQNHKDFLDVCFSIRQAIGFVNKLMVGNEVFLFDDACGLSYSNNIRPTITGMYSPITTNPYSYLDIVKNVSSKYINKLTRLSLENLSNLVRKIHTEPEFSVAILIILEASSLRSLLIIPSSFAVIIEQLSKHLSVEEKGLEKPIENQKLKNTIIEQLNNVIDNNCKNLSIENITKLKRRINEINKPINKQHLTNNEKLTRPFEQLGIKLTSHDISIIGHRNDLLHGNILLKTDEYSEDDEKAELYMGYVSAKLFTLISKLILKSIGYNGYIYNQSKYLEKYLNINTEEEYFEKI